MKVSIVIPTYNHLKDHLEPCIESLLKYTNFKDKEAIIIANGCTDGTAEYLARNLPENFKALWFHDPLGFTKAINEGIKIATGEYIVLLNNDIVLLPQEQDAWINVLEAPFLKDKDTGITGPIKFWDYYGGVKHTSIAFWCAMFKRKLVDEIGLLDEIFSPGMGEDTDYSIKAEKRGYKLTGVVLDINHKFGDPIGPGECLFPICHTGNGTFGSIEAKDDIIVRNHNILAQRYGNKSEETTEIPKTSNNNNNNNASTKALYSQPTKEISVVIPTYNHCADLLKPCIESMIKYTNLYNMEVLIVANGCIDETKEYVESLGEPFKLIWADEKLGYTKATNLGIKNAKGKYVVLLNNDTVLLPQDKNTWIDMLKEPFVNDPKVGMSGPLMLHDDYADEDVLIFFCAMISREVFEKIGYLDEIYSPGGGEDIDFTIRCRQAGYKAILSNKMLSQTGEQNVGVFPVYHIAEGTFSNTEHPDYGKYVIKNNGTLNAKRFNKHIKLNLSNENIPGYLSVAKENARHILMDVDNLDFESERIEEILASKVFEKYCENALKNWHRVLKSGGKVTLDIPDILGICQKAGFSVQFTADRKIECKKI